MGRFLQRRCGWLVACVLLLVGGPATTGRAITNAIEGDFTLRLAAADFGSANVQPEFSRVRSFLFEIDFAGPLRAGRSYANADLLEIEYLVSGSLDATPSGFPAFALDRRAGGREGSISPEDWRSQYSSLAFRIAQDAHLLDGVQLSELVPNPKDGTLLTIDALELKRLDVARYHPPQLRLYPDGTGILQNSNNSSGGTGTLNPGTGLPVDLDFGDEYITRLRFDPSRITIIGPVVPEPTTALLLGLGLAGLGLSRRRRSSGSDPS